MPDPSRLVAISCREPLRPYLALLYSAWCDAELSSGELRDLSEILDRAPGLDEPCRRAVVEWLDPARPPSAQDLAELAAHIRRHVPEAHLRLGPVEMGLRLAGSLDDQTTETLRAVERLVGPLDVGSAGRVTNRATSGVAVLDPLPEPDEAPFDQAELRSLLDGPHAATKRRVRKLLSEPGFRTPPGISTPEYRSLVDRWVRRLADEGIGGLGMPTEHGGAGDPGGFVAAFATLGHHDLSLLTKFGVQFGLFCGAVLRLGTERHHREILPGGIGLSIPGCFAMTETGHGSNVADLETTATYLREEGGFRLSTPSDSARKDYIGNALAAHRAVVFARLCIGDLDHGVHAFEVRIRSTDGALLPGVEIEDAGEKIGLNGVDNGRIRFDDVALPRGSLLDRYATVDSDGEYDSAIPSPSRRFFTTLGTLVGGRVSVAAGAVSAAESGLAIAVRYATRRRQFPTVEGDERPLIRYRSHQRRLMPRLATTILYHLAVADLTERYVAHEADDGDAGPDRRSLEARAAGLKAYATWHTIDVLDECRQACGGQGYLAENRIGGLRADADVFTTFEGDNTVLAQLVAKSLLTDYRSSFDDLTPARLLRHVRDRVNAAVTGVVPLIGAVEPDLADREVRRDLLERRSALTLSTLARRIAARTDAGMPAGDAFLDVQPHALRAARAAVECWVEDVAARVSETVADPDLRRTLNDIARLSTASMIEADLGWFLRHGVLNPDGAARVRDDVVQLSETLAPQARHLVDAFGIPDEVLAAPIAL